jgi:hypothetical protein
MGREEKEEKTANEILTQIRRKFSSSSFIF